MKTLTTYPVLTSEQAATVRRKFRADAIWKEIKMTLIGGWQDLAGFYLGSDGNVWVCQSGWVNNGPLDETTFRDMRGGLFTQPTL